LISSDNSTQPYEEQETHKNINANLPTSQIESNMNTTAMISNMNQETPFFDIPETPVMCSYEVILNRPHSVSVHEEKTPHVSPVDLTQSLSLQTPSVIPNTVDYNETISQHLEEMGTQLIQNNSGSEISEQIPDLCDFDDDVEDSRAIFIVSNNIDSPVGQVRVHFATPSDDENSRKIHNTPVTNVSENNWSLRASMDTQPLSESEESDSSTENEGSENSTKINKRKTQSCNEAIKLKEKNVSPEKKQKTASENSKKITSSFDYGEEEEGSSDSIIKLNLKNKSAENSSQRSIVEEWQKTKKNSSKMPNKDSVSKSVNGENELPEKNNLLEITSEIAQENSDNSEIYSVEILEDFCKNNKKKNSKPKKPPKKSPNKKKSPTKESSTENSPNKTPRRTKKNQILKINSQENGKDEEPNENSVENSFVIMLTGYLPSEKAKWENVIKKLGGRVTESPLECLRIKILHIRMTSSGTHVITNKVHRTVKFLAAFCVNKKFFFSF
jgi:hypothetical protein